MLMAARSLLRPLTFASIRARTRFASVYAEHKHPNREPDKFTLYLFRFYVHTGCLETASLLYLGHVHEQ